MTEERLQKIMAQAGIASRRKCEELIQSGKVTVDGQTVTELGTKVDPTTQTITVFGQKLTKERPVVIVMNKPRGVICSVNDPEGRETVLDIVKEEGLRLFPVGRLDYNTSGALLLTNDGELAHALTHPRFGAPKKYMVKFRGAVSDNHLQQWKQGVVLDDGTRTRPVIDIARIEESDGGTWVVVIIKEGKNRQIRRMADATGMQISKLKRVAFAGIDIEGLPVGKYRRLTPKELDRLITEYAVTPKDFANMDKPKKTNMPRRGQSASVPKQRTRKNNSGAHADKRPQSDRNSRKRPQKK
ncbi:MAG: rRNA pseudouridine synthase [Deltaproteobacteria bacterium]|nr:rRNA pseudouridine synthase [Deltaproteobacteria bacterium]